MNTRFPFPYIIALVSTSFASFDNLSLFLQTH